MIEIKFDHYSVLTIIDKEFNIDFLAFAFHNFCLSYLSHTYKSIGSFIN